MSRAIVLFLGILLAAATILSYLAIIIVGQAMMQREVPPELDELRRSALRLALAVITIVVVGLAVATMICIMLTKAPRNASLVRGEPKPSPIPTHIVANIQASLPR